LRKSRIFISATDRQTNGQTNEHHRCVKLQSRCRELRLNNDWRRYCGESSNLHGKSTRFY